jgi:hypothetical protein
MLEWKSDFLKGAAGLFLGTVGFIVVTIGIFVLNIAPRRQRDEAQKAHAGDRALHLTARREKHRTDLLEEAMRIQRGEEGWGDERGKLLREALFSHFPQIVPLEEKLERSIHDRVRLIHGAREKADLALLEIGLRRDAGIAVVDELNALADGAPSAFDCDWRWEVKDDGDLYFIIDEPIVPRGFVSIDKTKRTGTQYRVLRRVTLSGELQCQYEFEQLIRGVASSGEPQQLAVINASLAAIHVEYDKELAKCSLRYELTGECDYCPKSA